ATAVLRPCQHRPGLSRLRDPAPADRRGAVHAVAAERALRCDGRARCRAVPLRDLAVAPARRPLARWAHPGLGAGLADRRAGDQLRLRPLLRTGLRGAHGRAHGADPARPRAARARRPAHPRAAHQLRPWWGRVAPVVDLVAALARPAGGVPPAAGVHRLHLLLLRPVLHPAVQRLHEVPLGAPADEPALPAHRVPVLRPGRGGGPHTPTVAAHRQAGLRAGRDALPRVLRGDPDEQQADRRRGVLPLPGHALGRSRQVAVRGRGCGLGRWGAPAADHHHGARGAVGPPGLPRGPAQGPAAGCRPGRGSRGVQPDDAPARGALRPADGRYPRRGLAMTATGTAASTDTQTVELDVAGMTCAACANRVERALGKLDGVRASVNYATQRAIGTGPGAADVDRLVQQVESAGYGAHRHDGADDTWSRRATETRITSLRRRLVLAALLTVPLMD